MPRPRNTVALLLAAVPLALLSGACSQQDDPTPAELQADLAEELRDRDTTLSADQAECYAGLVVEQLGVDEIQDVDLSDEEPTAEVAEGLAAAAVEAREQCGLTGAQG